MEYIHAAVRVLSVADEKREKHKAYFIYSRHSNYLEAIAVVFKNKTTSIFNHFLPPAVLILRRFQAPKSE